MICSRIHSITAYRGGHQMVKYPAKLRLFLSIVVIKQLKNPYLIHFLRSFSGFNVTIILKNSIFAIRQM